MAYRIKLQNFEGPLDLLLFLIKKNEVDIYDIPIALITRQYLEYVQIIQQLDLEIASEFIIMAATLIRIKVQMLLPRPEVEEEAEEFDPRQDLIERLLEYKKYKEIAFDLSRRETRQRLYFSRSLFGSPTEDLEVTESNIGQVSLFDLLAAFQITMRRLENQPVHQIITPNVTVEEQIQFITAFLENQDQVSFTELLQHVHIRTRIALLATFLALLELLRRKVVLVKQSRPFLEIWIFNPHVKN